MDVKYSAFIIPTLMPFPDITAGFNFDPTTILLRGRLTEIFESGNNTIWKDWLGSLFWDEAIEKETFHIVAWRESKNPEVLDQENIDLDGKVYAIYHTLLLTEPFRVHGEGSRITGAAAFDQGKLTLKTVNQVSRPKLWKDPSYHKDNAFFRWMVQNHKDPHRLNEWRANWQAYDASLSRKNNFLLQLANLAFREGCHRQYYDFRFPNFVRAIETVIALRKGLGANDFSARTQKLIPPGFAFQFGVTPADLDHILKDAYQIRSDCVHGKPFAETLRAKLGPNFKKEIPKYEYAIETCARLVLQRALKDPKIIAVADTRANLESAWNSGAVP